MIASMPGGKCLDYNHIQQGHPVQVIRHFQVLHCLPSPQLDRDGLDCLEDPQNPWLPGDLHCQANQGNPLDPTTESSETSNNYSWVKTMH